MNKRKKGHLLFWNAWLLLFISGGLQAAGSGLDVTFKGILIDRQCVFEQGDAPLEVEFTPKAVRFFNNHSRTETIPFTLGLKNCTAALQGKAVDLTFSYSQTEIIDGVAMLKPIGNTGLVIALLDGAGNTITPNKAVDVGTIEHVGAGKVNRFTLGAYVMAPAGVTINAGTYSATATFMVSYR